MRRTALLLSLALVACPIEAERGDPTDKPDDTASDNAVDSGTDSGEDTGEPCTPVDWFLDDDGDTFGSGDPYSACVAPGGYVAADGDCDESRADVHPGASEQCDGADQDCDGDIDEAATDNLTWYADNDEDGHGNAASGSLAACTAPDGYVAVNDDCDDLDGDIFPGAPETCNDTDDDCDSEVDEGETGDGITWYADADLDGYGSPSSFVVACAAPDGFVDDDRDCNDGDDAINPAASETCDDVDQDCDGTIDDNAIDKPTWYADLDGDGFGGTAASFADCDAPTGYVDNATDCNDSDETVSPSGTEMCGGADENCDGEIDESTASDASLWYADTDNDTYGDGGSTVSSCTQPAAYVAMSGDCDDATGSTSPAGTEVCGGNDENCDGTIDEDTASDAPTWYTDGDGDGYGDETAGVTSCVAPADTNALGGDCDDTDGAVSPAETEVCHDGIDNDCNTFADDGCTPTGTYLASETDVVIYGEGSYGKLAYMADPGDVDGDGIGDIYVSAPFAEAPSVNQGAAYLVWGGTAGSSDMYLTYAARFTGDSSSSNLGILCGAHDNDNDGDADLVVSEQTTALLYFIDPSTASGVATTVAHSSLDAGGAYWGSGEVSPLRGRSDTDGDGISELLGTTFYSGTYKMHLVESGWTGAGALTTISDFSTSASVGGSTAIGDTNNDGFDDIVFGDSTVARVYVLQGPLSGTGVTVASVADATIQSADTYSFGNEVAAGDLDGDGSAEVIVGTYLEDFGGTDAGAVLVYSGVSGSESSGSYVAAVWGHDANQRAGTTLAYLPDMDGDGLGDLAIGSPTYNSNTGITFLLYGPISGMLHLPTADATVNGDATSWYLGGTLTAFDDVSGEGLSDLGMGMPIGRGATSILWGK